MKGHGGIRKNAGAKKTYQETSRKKTISLFESVAQHIESQPNQAQYINKLVKADMRNLTDRSG